MTQKEFKQRVNVTVSETEYKAIETVYMASDLEKDAFCAMWCKMNASRVKAAKEASKRATNIEKAFDLVRVDDSWDPSWIGVNDLGDQAGDDMLQLQILNYDHVIKQLRQGHYITATIKFLQRLKG